MKSLFSVQLVSFASNFGIRFVRVFFFGGGGASGSFEFAVVCLSLLIFLILGCLFLRCCVVVLVF